MKKLEIIKKILEENQNSKLSDLLNNTDVHNLIELCMLNEKYLTKENLNFIVSKAEALIESSIEELDIYYELITLVSKYIKIYDKLPDKITDNFSIDNWVDIIQEQPSAIKHCNKFIISKFSDDNWIDILKKQSQLIEYYKKINKDFLDEYVVKELLSENKEILKYIDIKKIDFDSETLAESIIACPEIINKISKNKLSKISDEDWVRIMEVNPNLINKCERIDEINEYLHNNIHKLISLICNQPSFSKMLGSSKRICTMHLLDLIISQPQLIEELNINLKRFDVEEWVEILQSQPQLIDRCDKLKSIAACQWQELIVEHPQLINYCDKLNELDDYDWHKILEKHPTLIDRCKINLTESTKYDLIDSHPELIKKINIKKLSEEDFETILYNTKNYCTNLMKQYIKKYKNPEVLTNMIGIYPDLKDFYTKNNLWKYVDFNELNINLEYAILK